MPTIKMVNTFTCSTSTSTLHMWRRSTCFFLKFKISSKFISFYLVFTVFTLVVLILVHNLFLTAADIVHSDSHKGCRGSQRHCFVGAVVVFEGTQRHRVGLPRSLHAIPSCFELLSRQSFPCGKLNKKYIQHKKS